MKNNGWQTLDVQALLRKREEATGSGAVGGGGGTTSANVGAYPVPLGQPLRRKFPEAANYDAKEGELRRMAAADPEYARALKTMGWLDD